MDHRQQTWRSAPPGPPQLQAPWNASTRPGLNQQQARGPPTASPVFPPARGAVPPFQPPGIQQMPTSMGQRPPSRPPPSAAYVSPSMPNAVPSPRAVQRLHGPPSVGNLTGAQIPGHVRPSFQPTPPPSFTPPPPATHLHNNTAPLPPTLPGQSHLIPGPRPPIVPAYAAPPLGPSALQNAVVNEVLDKFESLTLGSSAPGVQSKIDDAQSLPRPSGPIPPPPLETYPQNVHHSFLRMTSIYAPRSGSLRERFQFPYGAVLQPLAESTAAPSIPVIKLGTYGILRCRRCRTYINPFVAWVDDGRRWKCNVCTCLNETPRDFYCSVNDDGVRTDASHRPELSCGSVEYVAPPEYMVRAPMPAVYLFVVDVSSARVSAEIISHIARAIRSSLDQIQGDDRKRVGFMTFDRTLQFYNLKASDSAKMFVVPEIDDPFLPQPDDLLIDLEEDRSKVETFLETWSENFQVQSEHNQQSAMGAALQAAFMLLNFTGGKLELFLSSPPSLGTGAIKNRENAGLYNTEREMSLRNPEDSFYKRMAAECSRVHICIDIFSFCGQYTDLASIVSLARYTGGQVYRYQGFLAKRDGGRLHHDIIRNLTRYTAWEGVMRIRCSKGLKITAFCGHFFVRSTDLLALPTTDPDKAYAVEIKHDETVLDGNEGCIQCALLYTSSCGERRIRVHTLQFPITHEIGDLYRGADVVAITAYLAKFGMDLTFTEKLVSVQKTIEGKLISGLREYRILHSRHFHGPNQLIYPETLRLLPLWILSLLKSAAIRGNGSDVPLDERIAASYELMSTTIERIIHILCPTLYNITDIENIADGNGELPPVTPCSYEFLSPRGVYILDTSQLIFLLIGAEVPLEYLSRLSGVTPQALKTQPLFSLRIEPPQKNELSRKVCAFLDSIRERRRGYQPVILLQLGTEQEQHLWSFLIEDRRHSTRSYHDFVLMLHRQIGGK